MDEPIYLGGGGSYGPSPSIEIIRKFYQFQNILEEARREAIRNKIEKKARKIKRLRKKK